MIIGLTGSIASGKSTVAKMIEELNIPIIDADLVARIVVEIGSPLLEEIAQQFGQDVLREDGSLNREKLGAIIFEEPKKRKTLNDLMHPAIRKEMLRQRDELLAAGHRVIVMDIPLLFESKLQHFVDKILVVSVTEELQLKRLIERNGLTEYEAKIRIQSQLPVSEKEKFADAVIYNNGTLEETKNQLISILENWEVFQQTSE